MPLTAVSAVICDVVTLLTYMPFTFTDTPVTPPPWMSRMPVLSPVFTMPVPAFINAISYDPYVDAAGAFLGVATVAVSVAITPVLDIRLIVDTKLPKPVSSPNPKMALSSP